MNALLALEPISEIEELIDLDERFFAAEDDTTHGLQNCIYTSACKDACSDYCWATA